MPLKLNVGLSQKIGLPDYGSLGASCHVEVELEPSLLQSDPDSFHRHVRHAFVACRQAVEEELARDPGQAAFHGDRHQSPAASPATPHGNGQRPTGNGHANGHATSPPAGSALHRASQKQLDYALQLAGQIRGLGARSLEPLVQQLFAKPLADLSSLEASSLIDTLKEMKAGKLPVDAPPYGTAA